MAQGTIVRMPPRRARQIVSSPVLGMLMFVICEAMLFAGLISAFMIVEAGAVGGWPPPGQPRLPVGETAFNTAALLLSGGALFWAARVFRSEPIRARGPLLAALGLGAFFVAFQGAEWVALVREGLTLTSSTHGSFFYLIVGMHGLYAIGGLASLVYAWLRLARGTLEAAAFHAVQIFWYFVVGLWPILYVQVYL